MKFHSPWRLRFGEIFCRSIVALVACGLMIFSAFAQTEADASGRDAARLAALTQKVGALPEATTPQKLKKAALRLALEQAGNGLEVAQLDYAEALMSDVETAVPKDLGSAGMAPGQVSFLRPLAQPDKNPYLDSLDAWADGLLAQPISPGKNARSISTCSAAGARITAPAMRRSRSST